LILENSNENPASVNVAKRPEPEILAERTGPGLA